MTYRHKRSGAVIESESKVTGELWEEISRAPSQPEEAETEPKEDKRRRKK